MDRSSERKPIRKDGTYTTLRSDGFKDNYRTFHQKKHQNPNTFFLSTHKTFYRIDHILGHKTGLNKFKKLS